MPYSSIVFVKLKVELLHDYRFTDQLNDRQKLLYIGLLLMAGSTENEVKNDPMFIKRSLNLESSPENIISDLNRIMEVYPKLIHTNGLLKFKNFEETHNYTSRKSKGIPISSDRVFPDKIREDKKRIEEVLHAFKDAFKATRGTEYIPTYAKDCSIIVSLLKEVDPAELKELIGRFFKSNDSFIKGSDYTVGVFRSVINKLRAKKEPKVRDL